MENGMVKKICLIAAATLFGFIMIALLCGICFIVGSVNAVSFGRPGYEYSPPVFQTEQPPINPLSQLEQDMVAATALLYRQDEYNRLVFRCTATAFDREDDFYRFLTAAHCVAEDDMVNRLVRVESGKWFLNFQTPDNNKFYPARVLAAGYQSAGDDLAVMGATIGRYTPIIRLSAEDPKVGENVSNLAGPLNLGKQLFRGYVSREAVPGDANILVQVHCSGGSSGSAIVSHDKKAIVAVLVARILGFFSFETAGDLTVAVPISRFHRFWAAVQARNYEYFDWRSFESEPPQPLNYADELDAGEDDDAGDDIGGVED